LENAMAILPSIMAAVMAVLPTERSLPGMKVVMIQPSNSSFFEIFELSVRCFCITPKNVNVIYKLLRF
jgi:hypothetical protein